MPGQRLSNVGPRPASGGRGFGAVTLITWHRWRYRRAARRSQGGASVAPTERRQPSDHNWPPAAVVSPLGTAA